jgi:type II secretory pathway pseudopilin PulG
MPTLIPATTPAGARGPGSRTLIVVLLVVAAIVALLPAVLARSRRVQTMRVNLTEVLQECRVRYDAARTAADTAAADLWQPALHGQQRPGDPPCGPYRRRNMLEPAAR